jgi:hypothetical protein
MRSKVATPARIIDTGQSLGTDVVLKKGQTVSANSVGTQNQSVDHTETSNTDTQPQFSFLSQTDSQPVEKVQIFVPETYFITANGGVKIHRDQTGQIYLSIWDPVVLAVILGIIVLPIILFFARVLMLRVKQNEPKKETTFSSFSSVENPPLVRQIRRIEL